MFELLLKEKKIEILTCFNDHLMIRIVRHLILKVTVTFSSIQIV